MPMTRHWSRWEVTGRPTRGSAESPSRYPDGSHTEDHENGAVSTSEGGAVSLSMKSRLLVDNFDQRYYSGSPHVWRTPDPRYSLLEMHSTSTYLSSRPRGWCTRTRAAVRQRINRGNTQGFPLRVFRLRIYLSTYVKILSQHSSVFFLCNLHKWDAHIVSTIFLFADFIPRMGRNF